MLSDVMEHFGLSKSFAQVDGFETDHHRQLLKDLTIAIDSTVSLPCASKLRRVPDLIAGRPRPCRDR